MFIDKYTGKVKWFNVLLAKIGIIGTLVTGVHYGAHYSPYVQNIETTVVHGLRRVEQGYYRGDAHVELTVNKKGNLERYVVFMPSDERYALGEDGLPKDPEQLLSGLECRLKDIDGNDADKIVCRIRQLEQTYSNK